MTSDLLCCQVHPYSLYGLGLQFRWQVCSTVGAGKKGGKSPRNPIAVCASIINCREKGSQLIPNKHPRKEPDGQGLSQSKESKAVYLVDAKLVGNLLVVAPCQHYCPTLFRSRRRKICCSRNFKTRVIDFAFDLGFRVRNINIQ